ncbi:hypothetical protein SAMN05444410_10818 [Hydrobacter penzbergensis]|uniref:Uncharacterized protein n=1 Tax=Hydrobacter penzbergensis TaxID=1235997 RepID=A0A8X8ICU0_9BACT|nr:hypothetical protein [Hydrobacter penzbergensis]SDX00687.1 hypothetical protein SAMN05444410_10818 [Hydrobacter penzbergensis]
MKILLLGGRGYFGNEITKAISRNPANDVWIGSHSVIGKNIIPIQWSNTDFLQKIVSFDVIINAAPIPSDEQYLTCIRSILSSNRVFIETTADPVDIARLLAWQEMPEWSALNSSPTGGLFIHSAGIFPGLSNLFYKHFLERRLDITHLRLGIRYKILSGAGRAMCHLMASTILEPSLWIENNEERMGPPIGSGYWMEWQGERAKGFRAFLPDLLYIRKFYNIPNIETFLSVKPRWISWTSSCFNWMPRTKWSQVMLERWFYLIRGRAFKKTRTDLCMSLRLNEGSFHTLSVNDAFSAAGFFVAACVECLKTKRIKTGFQSINSCFNLEDILTQMNVISGKELIIILQ